MTIHSINNVKMSYFHNQNKPFISLNGRTIPADDAANLAGVNRQTLSRWCEGTHKMPAATARLFSIVYLGVFPWPEWDAFTMTHGRDEQNNLRWIITHNELNQWWTPERICMIAYGYDRAATLTKEVDTLRETINALSTRQPPPIPCAEIIPLEHYQDKKN